MVKERPNTIIIALFLIKDTLQLAWESITKGLYALISGRVIPLRSSRLLKIWHWSVVNGPKKFWHFPRSIQVGRALSTCIQVIFYPKK